MTATEKLRVEIPDDSPAVITERIRKGLEVCNSQLQKMLAGSDEDYQKLSDNLDLSVRRLHLLITFGKTVGVRCPFPECRDGVDFVCFGCPTEIWS